MSAMGIYCVLNTANGKRYIGQSTDLSKRRFAHFTALRQGFHKNKHLQAAFQRYGPSVFRWSVLQVICGTSSLDAAERHWIALYRSNDPHYGYNAESGGRTSPMPSGLTRLRMQCSQSKRRNRMIPDKCESPDKGSPPYRVF